MPDLDFTEGRRRRLLLKSKETKESVEAARKLGTAFPYYGSIGPERHLDYNRFLGSLVELLSREDAKAFPPKVLEYPVYADTSIYDKHGGAVGLHRRDPRRIDLLTSKFMHRMTKHGLPDPDISLYGTLLHEAGHARGVGNVRNLPLASIFDSPKDQDAKLKKRFYLLGEKYAQDLADSLLRARGFK